MFTPLKKQSEIRETDGKFFPKAKLARKLPFFSTSENSSFVSINTSNSMSTIESNSKSPTPTMPHQNSSPLMRSMYALNKMSKADLAQLERDYSVASPESKDNETDPSLTI